MKKLLLMGIGMALGAVQASAQLYARVGLGYAMPQAGQTISGEAAPYSGTVNSATNTYAVKRASFSAGVQGTVGIGYQINDHVGVLLDAGMGLANTRYTMQYRNININGVPSDVTISQKAVSLVTIMPSVVLQTGGDLSLYTRFGLALPLNTLVEQERSFTNQPGMGAVATQTEVYQLTNSFSLGFSGAVGVKYKLNDQLSLWGEVTLLSMSVYVKQEELTELYYNGQSIDVSQYSGTTVKYSQNVTLDSNDLTRVTYALPFSSVGLNVGITYRLQGRVRQAGRKSKMAGESRF